MKSDMWIKLYCAWSSFLQKCDRRIINLLLLLMASTGCGEILWHNTTMVWLPVLLTEAVCNTSCELYIPCMSSASTVQHKEYCMQLVNVCLSYQVCNCMPSDVKLWAAVFDKCCVRLCMCSCMCGCIHVYVYIYMCVCACIYLYISFRSSYTRRRNQAEFYFIQKLIGQTYKFHVRV